MPRDDGARHDRVFPRHAGALEQARPAGRQLDVADRARGPLGPLMSARREHLEAQGLLRPGENEEEVQVIRARRPAGAPVAA